MENKLSDWLTVTEAAKRLKTSERSVMRYAEKGKIELQKRERPGKKPENVANPRDVAKLLPSAFVMPAEEEEKRSAPKPSVRMALPESNAEMVLHGNFPPPTKFAPTGAIQPELVAPLLLWMYRSVPPPPWLSMDEAVGYSGLGASFLRRTIAAKKIEAGRYGPRGALRISYLSLFNFSLNGVRQPNGAA